MNKFFFLAAILTLNVSVYAQERPFVREQPFSSTQNTAQEVANLVAAKGSPVMVEWASEKNGHVRYCSRTYSDFGRVYEVCLSVYHDGRRDLELDYYLTTRSLVNLNPADVIADEIMSGRPKIHQEVHMNDFGVKGTVDIYQMFHKHNNGIWDGFTREERDLGEKAGVKEYLYDHGAIYQKRKFRKDGFRSASPEEKKEVQDDYQEHLGIVKDLLSK